MSPELFLAFVEKYGEDRIIAIGFDNSSNTSFTHDPFTLARHYDADIQCLMFDEVDLKGHPFKVFKSIDHIQTIVLRDEHFKGVAYDSMSIRG